MYSRAWVEAARALADLVERHEPRTLQPPQLPFLLVAAVDERGAVLLQCCGGLVRGDLAQQLALEQPSKSSLPSFRTRPGAVMRTVALRGSPLSRASSPKLAPGPSVATLPPCGRRRRASTSAEPALMT